MEMSEVAYCGLYCGLCASRRRIPAEATRLRASLHAEGYDAWFADVPALREAFPAFWELLGTLSQRPCPGCRAGGGYPPCPLRACARERQVELCNHCPDFPCARFDMVRRYPTCLSDNERMLSVGLERWVAEQEARAARGFVYADVRHPGEGR
jgi:hypothetical protein